MSRDNLSYRLQRKRRVRTVREPERATAQAVTWCRDRTPYAYHDGDRWHRFASRTRFAASLADHLRRSREGARTMIRARGEDVGTIRIVYTHQPPAPPTEADPRIKRIWRRVFGHFPTARSLGVFSCRRISGSSAWSAHASWKALDGTDRPRRMRRQVELMREEGRDLGIARIIYDHRVYEAPGFRPAPYRGVDPHETHWHVEVPYDPYATPECAR